MFYMDKLKRQIYIWGFYVIPTILLIVVTYRFLQSLSNSTVDATVFTIGIGISIFLGIFMITLCIIAMVASYREISRSKHYVAQDEVEEIKKKLDELEKK